ncbi:di-heme oxidoredictase family protein [Colwellia sp. 6_MG-2023]|uniref:di-heme oxidoredictase family protein n=1 Tax=Colwellia sp. 6_MG-2023 TaxID=3062676 RepID=UPI0026E31178|nr:di-heme oxidoredictase family protein [Colwellia sp. 6_MG-2023]MDO6488109.1 di-heme oxidoredictase family protein [Colwellia sp. 6_MG-2023]
MINLSKLKKLSYLSKLSKFNYLYKLSNSDSSTKQRQVKLCHVVLVITSAMIISGCNSSSSNETSKETEQPQAAYTFVSLLGGEVTAIDASDSGHGFSTPMPNLTAEELDKHLTGDTHFETAFTTAPNNEHPDLDGLGPVFNNQDCNSCHQRDGRPSTITLASGESRVLLGSNAGIFLRMSIDDGECLVPSVENNYCKNVGVDGFGTQLFHRGVLKARDDWQENPFIGQANVYLSYEYSTVTYADGNMVTLKKPMFTIEKPYDVAPENSLNSAILQANVRYSPRNGMPIFGLGLLELISEADILALADENDTNNDGISGRPNWVFDPVKANNNDPIPVSLGRFGWKASTPSVRVQSLAALRGDMGITNPLFPEESVVNTPLHESYLARTGFVDTGTDEQGNTEATQQFSDEVVFYAETLAVPARRNINDESVIAGAQLFTQVNCTGCHQPDFITSTGELLVGGLAAPEVLKGQHIYPFTDMLLHDLGEGLADNRRDFTANGQEWKTRPLWGIGLTKTVNPAAGFLHDGRAADVEEAILWHGGEAEQSKNAYMALAEAERQSLIDFVMSL